MINQVNAPQTNGILNATAAFHNDWWFVAVKLGTRRAVISFLLHYVPVVNNWYAGKDWRNPTLTDNNQGTSNIQHFSSHHDI